MRALVVPVYLALIYLLPGLVAVGPLLFVDAVTVRLYMVALAPALWVLCFVFTAGLLSRRHQHAIRPGRFVRSLDDPDYWHRRLYGLCWTSIYYCTPVYFICLSVPSLKRFLFRLFGYRGTMDFTLYPDTWIRDLPLLDIGPGAYVANRVTLGTNMVLSDNTVLVDRVGIGAGALIGHLAMMGPGTVIGCRSEIGVGAVLSVRVIVGEEVVVGAVARIDSGVKIADRAIVGRAVYLGPGTQVQVGAKVAAGANVPARSDIKSGGG